MDAELAALAASGATTVVQLMAQDAWTTVRERVLALFGRGAADRTDSVRAALDATARVSHLTCGNARTELGAACVLHPALQVLADIEAEQPACHQHETPGLGRPGVRCGGGVVSGRRVRRAVRTAR